MNPTTRIVGAIGIALSISSAASHAQSWTDNLYLHTDIGPAFLDNGPTIVRGFSSLNGPFAGKGHFQADTGIRGDLSVGYNLTKSFAIEVESGAIWNPGPNENDSFYQIPVMLNAIYQIQLNDSWKVYGGAGAGAVISITHSTGRDAAFHSPYAFDDSDWSAGYQAEAGIKYARSRHVDIDLGYKFLGVAGYEYHFRNAGPIDFEKVNVNDLFTHSVQLSLTWKF